MSSSQLLKKIFNIKEDYVEIIPGDDSPEKDKKNLDNFINEIKSNNGKLVSISSISCSNLMKEHVDRYVGPRGGSEYIDDYEYYTKLAHHFIIHYKGNKKIRT